MASGNYRLCDICRGKSFYDANLNYEMHFGEEQKEISVKENGQFKHYDLDYLGNWSVLCQDCSKTYEIIIKKKEECE